MTPQQSAFALAMFNANQYAIALVESHFVERYDNGDKCEPGMSVREIQVTTDGENKVKRVDVGLDAPDMLVKGYQLGIDNYPVHPSQTKDERWFAYLGALLIDGILYSFHVKGCK